ENLSACGSRTAAGIDFAVRHGDVLFVDTNRVQESSFGELVFDLFYQQKSFIARNLWRFRGWLGRVLGWERHPKDGVFPNQWRDPAAPFAVGQKLGFMELVRIGAGDELLLHIQNRTVEAYFVVRREGRRLYMGSIVNPLGPFGHVYWWVIQPFHKLVM